VFNCFIRVRRFYVRKETTKCITIKQQRCIYLKQENIIQTYQFITILLRFDIPVQTNIYMSVSLSCFIWPSICTDNWGEALFSKIEYSTKQNRRNNWGNDGKHSRWVTLLLLITIAPRRVHRLCWNYRYYSYEFQSRKDRTNFPHPTRRTLQIQLTNQLQ